MNRIKLLRKVLGYSQKELGEKLGVSMHAISKWELGQRNPSFEELDSMCDLFDVDLSYLLGRSDINSRGLKLIPGTDVLLEPGQTQSSVTLIMKALDIYDRYLQAPKTTQQAIDTLLGVSQEPPVAPATRPGKREQS